MPKWAGALLLVSLAILFLIANRAAYEGYFQDDDLDNLSWTRTAQFRQFAIGLVSPRFFENNFRPAGHLFYFAMGRTAGLRFPWYIAAIQALHLCNIVLIWLVLRRLRLSQLAAASGALLVAFHAAALDAWWKPMYVFDVLCASFCLAALFCWIRGRWILSFVAFWLAYKSKEVAVMLPAVLLAYELWLGERRWKRLLPFLAVSLSFGLQGMLRNPHPDDPYTLRFTLTALWTSLAFYSSRALLLPYAGLALLALPLFFRDRRLWFGLASAYLFLVPMLFLPGRLSGVYLYVPFLGLAIVLAALVEKRPLAVVVLFFLLWLPANYLELRTYRKKTLSESDENRIYVTTLAEYAATDSRTRRFIYDALPSAMHPWGVNGALRYLLRRADIEIRPIDASNVYRSLAQRAALLSWNLEERKLRIIGPGDRYPEAGYLSMRENHLAGQLGEGWYQLENGWRWSAPRATAILNRPASADSFQIVVNANAAHLRAVGRMQITVLTAGLSLGERPIEQARWQTVRWDLPPGKPGPVLVELQSSPEFRPPGDPRGLGASVAEFGFVKR